VGVGIHAGEYARAGVDYHRRGQLMDEGLAAVRAAWDTTADPAPAYKHEPASSPVPVWIGGASPAARQRAARVGDGWIPLFVTADDYGPALAALRSETAAHGRPADAVTPAVVVFVHVGADDVATRDGATWLSAMYGLPPKAFERHLVAGSPQACAAKLSRFTEAGARHIVVMVAGTGAVSHFAPLRAAFVAQGLSAQRVGPVPPEPPRSSSDPYQVSALS